jgi:hypothetical protein
MPRALRTGGLIALAIAIPLVVASATYAIGVRSLAPTTRLQVNVSKAVGESPSPGRSSDNPGDPTPGHDGTGGGGSSGTSGGSGPTPGGASPSDGDHHGGKSGTDDGGGSGSGSGSSGSGSSGTDSHGGGDD